LIKNIIIERGTLIVALRVQFVSEIGGGRWFTKRETERV